MRDDCSSTSRAAAARPDGLATGRDARPAEADHARVLRLAAGLFGVDYAGIVLFEQGGLRIAAQVGLPALSNGTAPVGLLAPASCDGIVFVPDAAQDERFSACPLVTGQAQVRFYAGAALVAPDGNHLGLLFVADPEPRADFPAGARAGLAQLAAMAADRLDAESRAGARDTAAGFVRATQSAVLMTNPLGTITFANPACESLLGYDPGELIGRNVRVIVPARFHGPHDAGMAALVAGGAPRLAGKTVEVTAVRRDGSEVPIELSLSSWGADRGAVAGIGAEIRDISERRRRDARLLRLAHHDTQSGLPNRAGLMEDLRTALENGGRASVLALAIEGLRSVNDTFGHVLGDALLEALTVRLRAQLSARAVLARTGIDELAVLLPGQADPIAAKACAQDLLSAFADPIRVGEHLLHVGAAVGGALAPNDGADAEEVLASADLALHQARRDGTRNFRLFEAAMRSAAAAQRALRDSLRLALERREFELHYQPQVDLETGRTCGAEALIRWRHPQRGIMAPGEFLPAIESSVLALSVGLWTIDEACRQAAEWRVAGLGTVRIAVNLFAAQLRAGTLIEAVTDALERHGLPPQAIELELTEIIAIEHDEATLAPIRTLLGLGIGIAFDDFGTGFASLSTLKNFPLSKLKIDRSFVRDILTDPYDAAIVRAVIDIGRGLGLAVIAEGIETEDQEQALAAMGCRLGQGFRYGRALEAPSFARRLTMERDSSAPAADECRRQAS